METNSFLSCAELFAIGFAHVGQDVAISRKASIYNPGDVWIGDHVRIDDFCVLSGNIRIGNHVHIGCYTGMFAGKAGLEIGNHCGTAGRVLIYAISDDLSGEYLAGPTVPMEYRKVITEKVVMKDFSHVGAGSTVLPGSLFEEGAVLGPMSLVYGKTLASWSYYFGNPARRYWDRKRSAKNLAEQLVLMPLADPLTPNQSETPF